MKRIAPVFVLLLAVLSAASAQDKQSSFTLMKPETQAMQRDDMSNPAMLWVQEGRALWSAKPDGGGQSCADCHGDISAMRGVAARYPAFNSSLHNVVTFDQQIIACRRDRQNAPPFPLESRPLLSLSAAIGLQSRGLPITPPSQADLPSVDAGRALFLQRRGQMNLSCAQCHDDHAGMSLGGAIIPQGHPTGYPLYRLEWQDLGSLERRLRNCMVGVRSEPFVYGSDEMVALQSFLRARAAGLPIETPAVRP